MPEYIKVCKLVIRLNDLTRYLDGVSSLTVHTQINQFYYMQKAVELELLASKISDETLNNTFVLEYLQKVYQEVFVQWRKDARWLSRHEHIRAQHDCFVIGQEKVSHRYPAQTVC